MCPVLCCPSAEGPVSRSRPSSVGGDLDLKVRSLTIPRGSGGGGLCCHVDDAITKIASDGELP